MKKYHFIGIGGIGMSGLAHILLQKNNQVSGSDHSPSYITNFLQEVGAEIQNQSKPNFATDTDVIYSSAIPKDHPEFQLAKKNGNELLHRSELLHAIAQEKLSIAITGSHGKTFTSALLAHCLIELKQNPSYCIGGLLQGEESSGSWNNGKHFVMEADESDGSFLNLAPDIALITNVDDDHLDHFGSKEKIEEAFLSFASKAKSTIYCMEDIHLPLQGLSYGFQSSADLLISEYEQKDFSCLFSISWKGNTIKAEAPFYGKHLALNAAGVILVCLQLGFLLPEVAAAIQTFQGVNRRQQVVYNNKSLTFIDDYAHHPVEIEKTLQALQDASSHRKVIALFQPHRFSRLDQCFEQFCGCFEHADSLHIVPVYSAGEPPGQRGINELFGSIKHKNKQLHDSFEDAIEQLETSIRPHDIVISLGAGNINQVLFQLKNYFQQHNPIRYKVAALYGGNSIEHDVTKLSFENVQKELNDNFYDVTSIYLAKDKQWLVDSKATPLPDVIRILKDQDLCFPVFHSFGEDGTMQGFFEVLDIAYTSSNVLSCAMSMDKEVTYRVAKDVGVKTPNYYLVRKEQVGSNICTLIDSLEHRFSYPMVVKPSSLGSSIHVLKVQKRAELENALQAALLVDSKVLVEEYLVAREFEIGVIGIDKLTCTNPVEILKGDQIFDMNAKYYTKHIPFDFQPNISLKAKEKLQSTCKKLYQALECDGFSRIDLFMDDQENVYILEANPIPGFTSNSRFGKMFAKMGIAFTTLLDQMVILGLYRHRNKVFYAL